VTRITAARQIISKNTARPSGGGKPAVADAVQEAAAKTAEATSELRKMFSANFTYPPLARRRGWEGEVRLGLRLEPDGRLTHIHIVKSSGFAILDTSALKTARGLGLAPAAARWLQGEWFDMILPVRYQLNDG
jgi:protein TonB